MHVLKTNEYQTGHHMERMGGGVSGAGGSTLLYVGAALTARVWSRFPIKLTTCNYNNNYYYYNNYCSTTVNCVNEKL